MVHESGDVRHGRIDVAGAHRVADRLALLDQRFVVLHAAVADAVARAAASAIPLGRRQMVERGDFFGDRRRVERLALGAVGMAAFVQEKACQVEIAPLAGRPVEPDQREFHFFVAAHVVPLAGTENAVDVVGKTAGGVQDGIVAGEALMLDRHFEEVTRVVELMLQPQVFPALLTVLDDIAGDQKAIVLLGRHDAAEHVVDAGAQGRIVVMLQADQGTFQGLVQVGVESVVASQRLVGDARRHVKIGHMPVRLEAVERMRDRHLQVRLLSRPPETAVEMHPLMGNVL